MSGDASNAEIPKFIREAAERRGVKLVEEGTSDSTPTKISIPDFTGSIPDLDKKAINREKTSVEVIRTQQRDRAKELAASGVDHTTAKKKLQPFQEDIKRRSRLAHQIESEFKVSDDDPK